MFRHIVLFRVHDGVPGERVTEAIRSLRSLAVLPDVLEWRIEESLDRRKGRILVEDATFRDQDGFDSFRAHPDHIRAGEQMAQIADWWNGDYIAPRDGPGDAGRR